jgi:type IV pilus assembly protein PilE
MQYPNTIGSSIFSVSTKRHSGFTLIELLITLAIISILTAVAYPSYSNYTRRSHISEGLTQLADLRLQQEQYYQDNRTYLKDGSTDECAVLPKTNNYFTFTCTQVTSNSFTWTASSKNNSSMGAADAYQFTIDNNGNQKTTIFDGESKDLDCWQVNSTPC